MSVRMVVMVMVMMLTVLVMGTMMRFGAMHVHVRGPVGGVAMARWWRQGGLVLQVEFALSFFCPWA